MNKDFEAEDGNIAPEQSESMLLASIAEGDVQAMSRLIRLYSELVYSVAQRVLRDQAAAEDVMQEVFLQIWRKPASFVAARGSIRGFLAIIARNKAIDVLRQRHPTVPVEDVWLGSLDDVGKTTEQNLMIESVRKAMQDLPSEQSEALDMAFFGGCTHVEIAKMTGSPLGTVKTRVRIALLAIGKALGR